MQFSWIFALVIGGVILSLAIFFGGKLFAVGTYQTQAELTKNLDVLLNPFASIRQADVSLSKPISLPEKTNVSFECSAKAQTIKVQLERGKEPFTMPIQNKYIFSEDFNTKELWVFGKTFEMPWRVDNLIYVISKNYCFSTNGMPETIKRELSELNSSKMILEGTRCDVKVCFQGTCNIVVDYNAKTVRANKRTLQFFDDSTMYGAIFDPDEYGCNLDRLMKRLDLQADILLEKANLLKTRGCIEIGGIKQEITGMKASIASKNYQSVKDYADRISNLNIISCPLY